MTSACSHNVCALGTLTSTSTWILDRTSCYVPLSVNGYLFSEEDLEVQYDNNQRLGRRPLV